VFFNDQARLSKRDDASLNVQALAVEAKVGKGLHSLRARLVTGAATASGRRSLTSPGATCVTLPASTWPCIRRSRRCWHSEPHQAATRPPQAARGPEEL